jgi:hypothetical protein
MNSNVDKAIQNLTGTLCGGPGSVLAVLPHYIVVITISLLVLTLILLS